MFDVYLLHKENDTILVHLQSIISFFKLKYDFAPSVYSSSIYNSRDVEAT